MAAITSAVVGVAGTVYASRQASRQAQAQQRQAEQQQQQQTELGREAIQASDPYAAHRGAAASRLNALMADPSSIKDSAAYKARMQAGQRQLAAQGYTGSGNALVEAAEAAGTVYQQEFDNLARLAGADATPGAGYGMAMQGLAGAQGNVLDARAAGNEQRLNNTLGMINAGTNLVSTIGQRFNRAATPTIQVPRSAVAPISRTRLPAVRPGG